MGGKVTPEAHNPVLLTRANVNEYSDYTFQFSLATGILTGSTIDIEFPQQYVSGLGITTCSAFAIEEIAKIDFICSVSDRKVTINMSVIEAGVLKIGIRDVLNPSTDGGTGTFRIWTYYNNTLRDKNEIFPSVGISPAAPTFTDVSLRFSGEAWARYTSRYIITATLPAYLPSGSWMRVTFPDGYLLGTGVNCSFQTTGIVIECTDAEDGSLQLHLNNLPALAAGEHVIYIDGATNPGVTGTTGTFWVEALQENTYNAVYATKSIAGVVISTGTISKIQIEPHLPKDLNLARDYTIRFYHRSPLPTGGKIQIYFPNEFNGLTTGTCSVVEGLSPTTGTAVTCSVSGLRLEYTNFDGVEPGFIKVKVEATNPSVLTTDHFRFYTYDANNVLIDQKLEGGTLFFSDINTPTKGDIDMFEVKVDQIINSYGPIQIFLQTRTTLPATVAANNKVGRIEITIPGSIEESGAPVGYSCLFGRTQVPAANCDVTIGAPNTVIKIDTPPTEDFDSCPLAIVVTTLPATGTPLNEVGFRFPLTSHGEHEINVKTYVDDVTTGNHIEEADFRYHTKPKPFGTGLFAANIFHKTEGLWNVIEIDLEPEIEIPANGYIEIELRTDNYGFPFDLGWGMVSLQTQNYPCVLGWTITPECTLKAGTTVKPAIIRIKAGAAITIGASYKIILPRVKNGPYNKHSPEITVRTLNTDEIAMEEETHYIDGKVTPVELVDYAGTTDTLSTIENTETNPSTTHLATQDYVFTFKRTQAIDGANDDDWLVIYLPITYRWTNDFEKITPTACASPPGGTATINAAGTYMYSRADNPTLGVTGNYQDTIGARGFIIKLDANAGTGDLVVCYAVPEEHAHTIIPDELELYVIIDGEVDNYRTGMGTANTGSIVHTINPTPLT